jgi:hypothetical protein
MRKESLNVVGGPDLVPVIVKATVYSVAAGGRRCEGMIGRDTMSGRRNLSEKLPQSSCGTLSANVETR